MMGRYRGGVINFSIDLANYQADEGMTWREWISSAYNTDGYKIVTRVPYGETVVDRRSSASSGVAVSASPDSEITSQNYTTYQYNDR